MEIPLYSVLIVIMLILSALFSAVEEAYSSLNKVKLKTAAQDGDKKAERVLALSEKQDRLLTSLLICDNIANVVATVLGVLLFMEMIEDSIALAMVVAALAVVALVLIFGEMTPRILAGRDPEKTAKLFAGFAKAVCVVCFPLTWLFGLWRKLLDKVLKPKKDASITDDELITYVDEAQTEGGIDEYEGELIRSAIEFDDLTVEDVLTPRVDVAAVRKGQDMDSVLDVFRKTGYSRLPVYKDTIDNVIGLLNEKDFYKAYLAGAKKIDGAVSDNLIYAAPTMKISALLRKLQQEKTHLAIVVDEFGGTLGIVTLEDILEELVGDIWDEHDRVVQSFTALGDGSVEVSGDVKLDEFFDYFGIEADADEYDVVQLSGVVFQELGRVPQKGDRLEFYGYEIEVSEVAQKRAVKCVVRKTAEADEPTDEGKDKQDKDKQEI